MSAYSALGRMVAIAAVILVRLHLRNVALYESYSCRACTAAPKPLALLLVHVHLVQTVVPESDGRLCSDTANKRGKLKGRLTC